LDIINELILSASDFLWSTLLIYLLIGAGLYFTIRTKGAQFKYLGHMLKLLSEKADNKNDNSVTSLQAFFIGAATRIGTGNIAGVALAISIGGPGAVFWMWLVALLGGASAFVEATLAQIYKVKDGSAFKGGPSYYIEKQLGYKWMSVLFSIFIIVAFGLSFNSVQSNTITGAFAGTFDIGTSTMGIILTVLSGVIIFGGVKLIARFSSIIVPVMAVFYIILAAYVILTNITEVPAVIALIFKSAFGFEQALGGGIGTAILMGAKRGLFSNEAGMGSAPNAAAAATVSHPVKQGFVQTLGVFFDTLIVCSATAFIILLSDVYTTAEEGISGAMLTQASLAQHYGDWAQYFLTIAIFMFAFSSIVGNYYYGEVNINYLTNNKIVLFVYRLAVLAMVYVGSVASLDNVWNFADLSMGLMALINLTAILLLGRFAFGALDNYFAQVKKGIDPVFYKDDIPGLKNVESWPSKK
jgi:AGCS family alanine or glycine:cation symporter